MLFIDYVSSKPLWVWFVGSEYFSMREKSFFHLYYFFFVLDRCPYGAPNENEQDQAQIIENEEEEIRGEENYSFNVPTIVNQQHYSRYRSIEFFAISQPLGCSSII